MEECVFCSRIQEHSLFKDTLSGVCGTSCVVVCLHVTNAPLARRSSTACVRYIRLLWTHHYTTLLKCSVQRCFTSLSETTLMTEHLRFIIRKLYCVSKIPTKPIYALNLPNRLYFPSSPLHFQRSRKIKKEKDVKSVDSYDEFGYPIQYIPSFEARRYITAVELENNFTQYNVTDVSTTDHFVE